MAIRAPVPEVRGDLWRQELHLHASKDAPGMDYTPLSTQVCLGCCQLVPNPCHGPRAIRVVEPPLKRAADRFGTCTYISLCSKVQKLFGKWGKKMSILVWISWGKRHGWSSELGRAAVGMHPWVHIELGHIPLILLYYHFTSKLHLPVFCKGFHLHRKQKGGKKPFPAFSFQDRARCSGTKSSERGGGQRDAPSGTFSKGSWGLS